ncbi:MAG TPA: universal stress protein [Noviherbaspirillum sp.]|nr:universal stress protein [Noviherbaspirillum sp.]
MSYKTILVHADKCRHAKQYIDIAASIAVLENAHLIGVATTGVSRYIYQSGMMDPMVPATSNHLVQHLETLRQRARDALDDFETQMQKSEVVSWESAMIDDEAGAGLALRGRYSDLLVLGQANPDEPSPVVMPDFPEYVVLNAGRPVLVVPHAGRFDTVGKRVLVAWDAGVSATRAVVNAIPMLKRADIVEVAVFNAEERGDAHGDVPGADIALYLARHGVKVDVIRQKTRIDVGNSLLSLAADLGSDMLVTGCYGHSRFREILLGGVTRTLLESMTVPVLMSA